MIPNQKTEPLEPSALWAALTALPRPTRTLPIPRCKEGTDEPVGEVVVWVLTQEEQMLASSAADKFARELLKDPQKKDGENLGYHHLYTNEVAIQVLHRACRDPENVERPVFPSPKLMRQTLSTDEIGVLFAGYCTIQSELGPIRAHLTHEECEGLILRLAEGGSAFPLDSLAWEQQRTLALFMASQLHAFMIATCSLGSPPVVSSFVRDHLLARQESKESAPEQTSPSDGDESSGSE